MPWQRFHPGFRRLLLVANFGLPPIFLGAAAMGNWPVFRVVISIAAIAHALLLWAIFHPRCAFLGPLVASFRPDSREVWLTIDDGPDGESSLRLAQALQEKGVPATFVLIGARARQQPEVVRAVLAAGHSVANHSETHPQASIWCAGLGRLRREVGPAAVALEAMGGRGRWFRPPVGHKSIFLHPVLQEQGAKLIAWTVGGCDGWRADPAPLVCRVLASLRPGAILMLHERRPHSLSAILAVVEAVQAAGYRFVVPTEDRFNF